MIKNAIVSLVIAASCYNVAKAAEKAWSIDVSPYGYVKTSDLKNGRYSFGLNTTAWYKDIGVQLDARSESKRGTLIDEATAGVGYRIWQPHQKVEVAAFVNYTYDLRNDKGGVGADLPVTVNWSKHLQSKISVGVETFPSRPGEFSVIAKLAPLSVRF